MFNLLMWGNHLKTVKLEANQDLMLQATKIFQTSIILFIFLYISYSIYILMKIREKLSSE